MDIAATGEGGYVLMKVRIIRIDLINHQNGNVCITFCNCLDKYQITIKYY